MIEVTQGWAPPQSPYTGSATLVPGAPGWWDWVAGDCPRCRTHLGGYVRHNWSRFAPWGEHVNRRHELTFPLSHCWLCRVQQGYFIHTSWEG